ncbi:unnamed protein product, partial [Ectocarpus sp. 12 AP-2014]
PVENQKQNHRTISISLFRVQGVSQGDGRKRTYNIVESNGSIIIEVADSSIIRCSRRVETDDTLAGTLLNRTFMVEMYSPENGGGNDEKSVIGALQYLAKPQASSRTHGLLIRGRSPPTQC